MRERLELFSAQDRSATELFSEGTSSDRPLQGYARSRHDTCSWGYDCRAEDPSVLQQWMLQQKIGWFLSVVNDLTYPVATDA
jgi:hypothetical protein